MNRKSDGMPGWLTLWRGMKTLRLLVQGAELERAMLHPRTLLPEMPCVTGDGGALGKLRNGNQANLADFSDAEMVKVFAGQRELVAVAKRVVGTLFQPMMVLG